MEMNDTIQLMDDEGNLINFDIIANLKVNDTEYAILEPEGSEEGEAIVFRIKKEDGEDLLEIVSDDEELLIVEEAYYELVKKEEKQH